MADLKIFTMQDIVSEPVSWLWEPYIPRGKITIVQGDPGDGKAKQLIITMLSNGSVEAAKIMRIAEEQGISTKTLNRAKSFLGVNSVKRNDQWFWEMPFETQFSDYGEDSQHGQDGQMTTLTIFKESGAM